MWFQFRLKTWVMLLVAGGVLYWLNATPRFEKHERVEAGELVEIIRMYDSGWPLTWLRQVYHTDAKTQERIESGRESYLIRFVNVMVGVIILWIVAYFGEKNATRSKRPDPEDGQSTGEQNPGS